MIHVRTGPNGEYVRAGLVARQLLEGLRRKQRDTRTRCPRCCRLFEPAEPPEGPLDLPLCPECSDQIRQPDLPGMAG